MSEPRVKTPYVYTDSDVVPQACCPKDDGRSYGSYDADVSAKTLISVEKYFMRWQVDVWQDGVQVFSHTFDPTGARVHFVFASRCIGDTIARIPYLGVFCMRYGVRASYAWRATAASTTRAGTGRKIRAIWEGKNRTA
ncbi:hypothetical protein [uncultured Mitsuokella sp.]|uniref:hypothetical protein n=1 Tax=uncultured Mitsuokella sp. TaxID=453120 RepID=UPI00261B0FD1|nr:hypothetical protein [uncultured Mitsuokella sp.]